MADDPHPEPTPYDVPKGLVGPDGVIPEVSPERGFDILGFPESDRHKQKKHKLAGFWNQAFFNHVSFLGRLVDDPKPHRYKAKGEDGRWNNEFFTFYTFHLFNYFQPDSEPGYGVKVLCKAFGNQAAQLANAQPKPGKTMIIQGSLRGSLVRKNGVRRTYLWLRASQIYIPPAVSGAEIRDSVILSKIAYEALLRRANYDPRDTGHNGEKFGLADDYYIPDEVLIAAGLETLIDGEENRVNEALMAGRGKCPPEGELPPMAPQAEHTEDPVEEPEED